MTPTSRAIRVHLRLLETWPRERIHVHQREELEGGTGAFPRGRTKVETERLHERIIAMDAKGKTRKEIAWELAVSETTVRQHLGGKIKCVKKDKKFQRRQRRGRS